MIFVTGGTGMVGSRLLAQLVKADDGQKIVALKRADSDLSLVNKIFALTFDDSEISLNKIQWVDGDLLDYFHLEQVIESDAEVYHAAALVSFQPKDAQILRQTNIEGTANLVNCCLKKGVRKFCFVSSIAALGRNSDEEITTEEDWRTTTKGTSTYSSTKFEAEMEVWRGIGEGLKAVIVNPSVILGAGHWQKGSSELITTVFRGLKFYTKGVNGYVDADDVAKAMILLMKSPIENQRFILSSENWDYERLFKTIARYLNVKGPTFYASPFMSHLAWILLWFISLFTQKQPIITRSTAKNARSIYRYSSQKIISQLGFEFLSIEESIEKSCKQFLIDFKG